MFCKSIVTISFSYFEPFLSSGSIFAKSSLQFFFDSKYYNNESAESDNDLQQMWYHVYHVQ